MSKRKPKDNPLEAVARTLIRSMRAESERQSLTPHAMFLVLDVVYNYIGTQLYGDAEQKQEAFGSENPTSEDFAKAVSKAFEAHADETSVEQAKGDAE